MANRAPTVARPDGLVLQLEGLRGLAALAVCLYHFHHVPVLAGLTAFAPGLFTMGWVFVDLFFILSGWVMGHVYHGPLLARPGAVRGFLVARVARLYPLVLATLVAWCLLMPQLGIAVDWAEIAGCLPQILTLSFTWGPLSCDVPVAPAWSISAEAAVYLAFPLVLWAGVTRTRVGALALIAVGALGYGALALTETGIHAIGGTAPLRAGFGFAIGLGLWRLGDLGWQLRGRLAVRLEVLAAAAILALVAMAALPLVVIGCFALLVAAMLEGRGPLARLCQTRPLVTLGRLSFGLYMWHWLVIIWMQQAPPSLPPLVLAVCAVLFVLAWAHISYRWLEAPARRAIRAAFAAQGRASASPN